MNLRNQASTLALSESISLIEKESLEIIRIKHKKAEVGISIHGGHLLWFKPTGQKDVIWLSETAEFHPQKAIRGGVPICWPWFGRIAEPAHGFARTSQWTLTEHKEDHNDVQICLELKENEHTLSIWPYKFKAQLIFEISDKLKIKLKVTNTDVQPWRFSAALHTYLNVADLAKTEITGMGSKYVDSLKESSLQSQNCPLTPVGATDRIYTSPESSLTLDDKKNQRLLTIENSGNNAVVIWTPWADGEKSMTDMPDDAYKNMLCIESTIFSPNLEEGFLLEPNQNHTLSTQLSSQLKG